jgi:hypothetical protein
MATTVQGAARIPLPIDACWARFRDLTLAKHYVPGLTDCYLTTDAKEGVGASRVVCHERFGDMNETVVAWDEGRGMTIRLHKGDGPARPFREAQFRYAFSPDPESPDATRIDTTLRYSLPGGPLGRLMDRLLLRRIFRQNVIDTAVCLAEYYRTNAPVDPDRIPALRQEALSPMPQTPDIPTA